MMIEQDMAGRDELAADTLERLRNALAGSETPSAGRIIEIIRQMSDKADVLSIQDLAEALGHDLTTMVNVIKAANCLQFNPSALEVSTLARAVSVIGFNKIQNLALSLMLLDGAENRVSTEEGRDVSAQTLCGALVAEEVTRHLALAGAEEAFVCTALRGYGRLLLSTFLADEYRQALQLSRQMPVDRAFRLTFGLTALEVSERILGEVNLSGLGVSIFQPVSPALLRHKHPSSTEALQLAAEFGSGLAELVSRPELTAEEYERQSGVWLDRFNAGLGLDRDALKEVLDRVRTRLDDFGRAQAIEVFGSVLMRRIKSLADGQAITAISPTVGRRKAPPTAPEELLPARGPLAAAVKRIKELLGAPEFHPGAILTIAASATRKALRAEGCVVFLRQDQGTHYAACAGEGAFFRKIENQALIDPVRRDVFTVCLSQGEDVLIQDPADARIAPFVPAWFHDLLDGGPFLLLPVKDAAGVFAIVCVLAPRGQRIELGVTRLPQFQAMRKLLAGLRGKTAQPTAATAPAPGRAAA